VATPTCIASPNVELLSIYHIPPHNMSLSLPKVMLNCTPHVNGIELDIDIYDMAYDMVAIH